MSQPDSDTALSPRLHIMRIIIFALVNGLVIFLGIAVFIRLNNPPQPANPNLPVVTFMALGFAVMDLLIHAILPNLTTAAGRRRILQGNGPTDASRLADDRGQLCALYQTRMIIGAALLEGAAFFLLIAYLLEGQVICLATAVFFVALIASKFPTRAGVENWIEKQSYLLQEERMRL
jgi:hypothetical protein